MVLKMDKTELIEKLKNMIREDLHNQLEVIIHHSLDEELSEIIGMVNSKSKNNKLARGDYNLFNKVCIEIDFLVARLKYFGRLPQGFETEFGVDSKLIPDLISKWRDEKLNGLL